MIALKNSMAHNLLNNILPFWMEKTVDNDNGGFYGKIHNNLIVQKEAPKGGVLNARILWTFSSAYRIYKKPEYLAMADRAYDYIKNSLIDKDFGGIYWSVDYNGHPLDTKKQIYAQAFAIYALSEYYKVSESRDALNLAIHLFELLEKYSYDQDNKGYFEACDREWHLKDFFLDEKCGQEKKSMNTMLHIMEAYTNLFRVWKNDLLAARLEEVIRVTIEKIVDNKTGHFKLFFDERWQSLNHEYSYGHDIEGSWLLYEAAQIVGKPDLIEEAKIVAIKMAEATMNEGLDEDGAVMYEGEPKGPTNTVRHWWPQAEGIVGFLYAYKMTDDSRYLIAAKNIWKFTEEKIIDHVNGEWYWGITRNGELINTESKVDLWKCPYHNSRACMEVQEI